MPKGRRKGFYLAVLTFLIVFEINHPAVGSMDFFQEEGDGLGLILASCITFGTRARRDRTLGIIHISGRSDITKNIDETIRGLYGYLAAQVAVLTKIGTSLLYMIIAVESVCVESGKGAVHIPDKRTATPKEIEMVYVWRRLIIDCFAVSLKKPYHLWDISRRMDVVDILRICEWGYVCEKGIKTI